MPTLARLAARAEVGRAAVIPAGMPPGSDVGNMSILGYDPARFHTGRAPIEAAALGLRLPADRVAYRCNLSTVGADGTMVDFAGGHPTTEAATEVLRALDAELGLGRRCGDRVPPRRAVPPHPRGPGRLGRRHLHPAPRPVRQAGGVADRARRPEAAGGDGRQPRHRRALRPVRQPGVALGPGLPAADAELRRPDRLPGRPRHGRRPDPRPRRAHGHRRRRGARRHRVVRHGLRGQARRRPARRSTAGPTSSSSTSRPPTRRATPATSRRRSRPWRTGTGASSPTSSPASTPWARGGCSCCPTTPPRSSSRPTRPTRCRTSWSTRPPTAPAAPTPSPPRDVPPVPGHELMARLIGR